MPSRSVITPSSRRRATARLLCRSWSFPAPARCFPRRRLPSTVAMKGHAPAHFLHTSCDHADHHGAGFPNATAPAPPVVDDPAPLELDVVALPQVDGLGQLDMDVLAQPVLDDPAPLELDVVAQPQVDDLLVLPPLYVPVPLQINNAALPQLEDLKPPHLDDPAPLQVDYPTIIVPDSEDEDDAQAKYFSLVVPDSEEEEEENITKEMKTEILIQEDEAVVLSHLKLSATEEHVFDSDRCFHEVFELFKPIMFPQLYVDNDDAATKTATSLLWMARGHFHP